MADVQQNGHNADANALVIEDLRVSVGDRQIVRGLNLTCAPAKSTRSWGRTAPASPPSPTR